MGSYRQRFLHDFPTLETFLGSEARVDSDDLMTSSCSLVFKDVEKRAPTGVQNAFCQGMILHHVEKSQLLNRNHLVLFGIAFGRLRVKVAALPLDLEMGLCRATGGLAAAFHPHAFTQGPSGRHW